MSKTGIVPGVFKIYVVPQSNNTTGGKTEILLFDANNNPSKITFRDLYLDNKIELIRHLRYLKT